jgi:Bacterial PH domain
MSLDQPKTKVVARIWQSIAQSGVSVSSIPQDQLDTLVNAVADGVLVAVDELFEDAGLPSRQYAQQALGASLNSEDEEKVLWEGRPFLSIATFYQITNQRVRIVRGVLGKDRDDVELIRIQDLDLNQSLGERFLNVGDILIKSSDPSLPEVTLNNVRFASEVHEVLRRGMLDARRKYRYSVQEEM